MKKRSNRILMRIFLLLLGTAMAGIGCGDSASTGAGAPLSITPNNVNLGFVASVAVLGGSAAGMTNKGTSTVIIGDMTTTGTSTMITGFHNQAFSYTETPLNLGAVTGTIYSAAPQGDAASFAIATAAQADATTLYNLLADMTGGTDPGNGQLGALTLAPGVYKSGSGTFLLTGSDLTLDAQGDEDAIWVFQMASSLTVGAPAAPQSVLLVNGAQAKNVYWQVGSAVTINSAGGGTMVGTIVSNARITFSTAGNAAVTKLNGRALSLVASITMANTVINAYDVQLDDYILPDQSKSHILLSGTTSGDISPTITGGGYITAVNNGGHIAVTVNGIGTTNLVNNGAPLSTTLTGDGILEVVNNGGVLSAHNTGDGIMSINNTCSSAVSVANTGNGKIFVTASGTDAVTIIHEGDDDVYYVNNDIVNATALMPARWALSGINAADISPTVTGAGFITVVNDGGYVTATVTGSGKINVVNKGAALASTLTGDGAMNIVNNGGVLSAKNTGNGVMMINNSCTAAVTVTNTGNGRVTVYATGTEAITITHTGDDDYTYGASGFFNLTNITSLETISHISVTGTYPGNVIPSLTGNGYINVINNASAAVDVTQTGNGSINILNNGGVLSARNNGAAVLTLNNRGTGALTVTSNTGGDTIVNVAQGADGAVTVTNNTIYRLTVYAGGGGGVIDFNGSEDTVITLPLP